MKDQEAAVVVPQALLRLFGFSHSQEYHFSEISVVLVYYHYRSKYCEYDLSSLVTGVCWIVDDADEVILNDERQ